MNKNELSKKAHANAIEKGFWRERKSNEHCLMLIVTEVAEIVEADRKNKRSDFDAYRKGGVVGNYVDGSKVWFPREAFEKNIKDTIEDEFADVAIRLADLAGALGVDFDRMHPCNYYRAFDKFSFTENAFALVKGLTKDRIAIEKRLLFGMTYIDNWATHHGINLDWHIEQKMKYNQGREAMHGKKY
jgi:NTP pyrophosphatase (non-canonical NTP hydrolase)